MKKIISMGIASAVLALTAVAASAEIAAKGAAEVENGKTIEVAIVTDTAITDYGVNVAADGLELVEVKGLKSALDITNTLDDGSVNLTGISSFEAGETIATFVYTVTADKDTDVNIALTGMPGYTGDAFANYTAKVVAEGTVTPENPDQPDDPANPDTGIALAVVPAVLAGAAVVVAKKRK